MKHTVILGDGHPEMIKFYCQYLKDTDCQIIAESTSPYELVEEYKKLRPNVVVLARRFGGQSEGLGPMAKILDFDPNANIVLSSFFPSESFIPYFYKYGAKAVFDKYRSPDILHLAVQAAANGQRFIDSKLSVEIQERIRKYDSSFGSSTH